VCWTHQTRSLLKLKSWSLIMYGSTKTQRSKNLLWLKVKKRRAKQDWFHIIWQSTENMLGEASCSEGDQPWKLIPLGFLSGVSKTLLFQCNYDIKYLNLSAKLSLFYKNMISHWQEFNNVVLTTKKDVLNQIAWDNRFTKINKASACFRSWHQAGIYKLSSLLDERNTCSLPFNEFLRKFNVK